MLNPKAKATDAHKKHAVNKEGAVVWQDHPLRGAILSGISLAFRPRRDFYYTDEEKFQAFIEALEKVNDLDLLQALIPYLRFDHGRKLAPMVVLGWLLATRKPEELKHVEKFINPQIVDTPKRMAEVVATYKLISRAKSFAGIPFAERFKEVLEAYDEYTLKKNRMRRRKIKLADLIKVFRPRPRNDEYSKLYKAIIENDPYASLKAEEHVTATLSSTDLSREEKQKVLEANVEKMPFNALVRNLRQFAESSLEVKDRIRKRFEGVLEALKAGDDRVRAVVNIFDLIDLALSPYWSEFGYLQDVVMEIVDAYVDHFEIPKASASVLIDISGSMSGLGITRACAFVAVLSRIYDLREVGLFNTRLFLPGEEKEVRLNVPWVEIRPQDRTNEARKVKEVLDQEKSVVRAFLKLHNALISAPCGGTALVDAYRAFIRRFPEVDRYVVITDEVTWADRESTWALEFLPNKEKQKTIIFNPSYMWKTVAVQSPKLLRITELTPTILSFLEIWDGDMDALTERIKSKYLASS